MFLEVENPNLSWSKAIPHPGGYKLRTWRRRGLVWAHPASQLATILASRKTSSILISHSLRHISWILVTILATGCEGRHPWRIKCATWSESHSVIGCFTATSLIFSGDFTGIFFELFLVLVTKLFCQLIWNWKWIYFFVLPIPLYMIWWCWIEMKVAFVSSESWCG